MLSSEAHFQSFRCRYRYVWMEIRFVWQHLGDVGPTNNLRHWMSQLQCVREARFVNIINHPANAVHTCLFGTGEDRTQHLLSTTVLCYSARWTPNEVDGDLFAWGGIYLWMTLLLRLQHHRPERCPYRIFINIILCFYISHYYAFLFCGQVVVCRPSLFVTLNEWLNLLRRYFPPQISTKVC